LAIVTYLGVKSKTYSKLTNEEVELGLTSLTFGPPTTKNFYRFNKGVPIKVTDLDDLRHFIDCARDSETWRVKLGRRELAKLKGFIESLGLKPSKSGVLFPVNSQT